MASQRPERLRHGLHPLSISSLSTYNPQQATPSSAISMTSAHILSAQTPVSAYQPYNPQQWASSSQVRPSEMARASPPPPPPYSPPRSQPAPPMSAVFDHSASQSSTPTARLPSATPIRHAPESQQNFPPPPGAGRAGSRDRRFGLPSLGRRREPETLRNSPDVPRSNPTARQSMGPNAFRNLELDRASQVSPAVSQHMVPPSSRRAASAGAVDTPTSARSRSNSQSRWEPGMPLPPPPPGPPPPGSRSHSVQPMDRSAVPIISPPTRRPAPSGVTSLGPVPPTPADWLDSDTPPDRERTPDDESLDTTVVATPSQSPSPVEPQSGSPTTVLNRAGAVRRDKTILQRRAESRTRHSSRGSIDTRVDPRQVTDIEVASSGGDLLRKLTLTKAGGPRSSGLGSADIPRSGDSLRSMDSRNSTPRAPPSAKLPLIDTSATPPFSPVPVRSGKQPMSIQGHIPKGLPTPPPLTSSASSSGPRDTSRPPPSATYPLSRHTAIHQTAEEFAAGAIERFQSLTEKEQAAGSDEERVRLFADFFVNESRIRRERYSSAIRVMGSEILDLTRDLFRPMSGERRASGIFQGPDRSQRDSSSSWRTDAQVNSAPGSATLSASPGLPNSSGGHYAGYMPSLSPILSMSVSENQDDSSRGRPPSRWWESESQGDGSKFERSKRESKYMGVPKEQWLEEEPGSSAQDSSSQHESFTDYPPEKVPISDPESALTPLPNRVSTYHYPPSSSPAPHSRDQLDVSRLVTIPPPYPRHHPAVNNNHPELSATRSAVRTLLDLSELTTVKEKAATDSSKRRGEAAQATSERQKSFKSNLQKEVSEGHLGFADAAAIEASTQDEENKKRKDLEKSEYERFQNDVVVPLNTLLVDRIKQATELSESLSKTLFGSAEHDADMPQEEGDDKPELLEKLRLLKWLFEARENLHKANYDLLSDRNTRYAEVIITPYRLSGNTEKLKSAEAFFAEDMAKRGFTYANEVLDRAREFRATVDSAVQRGVTIQLSAFWDVAPPLSRLLESIPDNLDGFSVQIPNSEYDENPIYHDHPLQYLYSLLLHAEKSAYQFIESHTNLLCLLHEVRETVVVAKARFLEMQVEEADGKPIPSEVREERAREIRHLEDQRLTEDLQEKVGTVQDQWKSALGEIMKQVKERTGTWLLSTGGWDETLEDEGVGVGVV